MSDEGMESGSNAGKWVLVVLSIFFVAASGYGFYDAHTRLASMSQEQTDSKAQIADLTKQVQSAEAEDEALARQLGITKKDLRPTRRRFAAGTKGIRRAAGRGTEEADRPGHRRTWQRGDGSWRSEERRRLDQERPRGNPGEVAKHDRRFGNTEWPDCQHTGRPRSAQTQRRSQLLRVHFDQGRETRSRWARSACN